MANESYTNFRLQGIPNDTRTRRDVQELVQHTLGLESQVTVTIHSLASSPIDTTSRVATLSFQPIPDTLHPKNPPEWKFPIPTPPNIDEAMIPRPRYLVFDTHFHGLTPLHRKDDQDCTVDLTAVSGLGGHAFGSFKERDGPFMWLRDALPWDLPKFRIFIYGYDTQLQDSSSFQNLTDLGKELRMSIHETRITGSNNHNRIIFLGHSLGGLVIKEAVVAMRDAGDELDADILQSTAAFFFFGVPHQGMATKFLVPLVKDQPNRALLESLSVNSPLLSRQMQDFPRAFGTNEPRVISFFETKESPTAKLVNNRWRLSGPPEKLVDPASATHGSKIQHPINRTHSEMVKFRGDRDREYRNFLVIFGKLEQKMIETMRTATRTAYSSGPAPESKQRECLQSLAFREQNLRRDDIIPAEDTCNWALTDPRYADWMRSTQDLLWIKGNPGVGKSTIMKHIWDTMQQNTDAELVASFFIHGRGVPLQKTLVGLYRALLNSLLGYFPDHLNELTRRFEEKETQFGSWENQKWEWNQPELQQFLSRFLLEASISRPIIIYIDALDEFGAENAKKLLEQLKKLKTAAQAQNSRLKICFSSRHYPILGLESVPTIYIEDQNDRDIRKVIRNILQEIEPVSKKHQIEDEVVSKAQGGFQWAVLVAAKAAELNIKGVNAQAIHEEIRKIPAELNKLYSNLLNIVDASERKQIKRLFQWVLCAQRPLKIVELREALALDTDSQLHSATSLRTSKHYCDSLGDTERRIKDLSKGLIEVKSREILAFTVDDESFVREVQFIHQSVPDFLVKDQQAMLGLFEASQSPFGPGNSEIARACVMYLGLAELLVAAERSWYHLTNDFPLADYAAQHLHQHVSKAETAGIPQVSLSQIVLEWVSDGKKFDKIVNLWTVLQKGLGLGIPTPWPNKGSNIWHFVAWCGVSSALDFLLPRFSASVDNCDCSGNTPLLLAVQSGHDKMASRLLSWTIQARDSRRSQEEVLDPIPSGSLVKPAVNPNATNHQGAIPMSLAIDRNAENIVKLLVKAEATLYNVAHTDRSALGFAIRTQDEDLLDEIIKRMEHLGNAPRYLLGMVTPTETQLRMLRKMLSVDRSCASELMYFAVNSKRNDLIEVLLECDISPNIPNPHSCSTVSPLCCAIQTEDLDLVTKLVRRNVDLSGALRCFAETHESIRRRLDGKVLRELVRSGAPASGLHMCNFVRRFRADLVQILLEFNVSPNTLDNGDDPLIIALDLHILEVVEVLVSCPDLKVNHALRYMFNFGEYKYRQVPDESGSEAKKDEDMIRLLLRHKNADVNQMIYDDYECGKMLMLTAAARRGHYPTVKLLLEVDSVLVDCESILPPYFPYASASVEVKRVNPESLEIQKRLETILGTSKPWGFTWIVAPLLVATNFQMCHVIQSLLGTKKVSEASIIDAYFVAQSLPRRDIMQMLKDALHPSRRLYRGGAGRQAYEIWIGPEEVFTHPGLHPIRYA